MSFAKDKYMVVRNAMPIEVANFIHDYFVNKKSVQKILEDTGYISQFNYDWGKQSDDQCPNQYCHYGDLVMDTSRHSSKWKGEDVKLTVTEFLILKDLSQRSGMVKTRDQLMDAAYGETIYVDDRTIDSHIKRLRKKFKLVDKKFEQIETLYGVGYRYRE